MNKPRFTIIEASCGYFGDPAELEILTHANSYDELIQIHQQHGSEIIVIDWKRGRIIDDSWLHIFRVKLFAIRSGSTLNDTHKLAIIPKWDEFVARTNKYQRALYAKFTDGYLKIYQRHFAYNSDPVFDLQLIHTSSKKDERSPIITPLINGMYETYGTIFDNVPVDLVERMHRMHLQQEKS